MTISEAPLRGKLTSPTRRDFIRGPSTVVITRE
jgi:hypothetical protein